MNQGIKIQFITFGEGWDNNPLPYVPAFCEWTEHVKICAPCGRVDQLARSGQRFDPVDLCEGGSVLQHTVSRRIDQQRMISLLN